MILQLRRPPTFWRPKCDQNLRALLEHNEEAPYTVRSRLRFVLKRRLHQNSIE
jgi:hypothetical protein